MYASVLFSFVFKVFQPTEIGLECFRCTECGVSDSDMYWHKQRTERTYDYVTLCAPVWLMEFSLPKLTRLENLELHGNTVNKYSAARFSLLLHASPVVRTSCNTIPYNILVQSSKAKEAVIARNLSLLELYLLSPTILDVGAVNM
jgi:hypothetical protein